LYEVVESTADRNRRAIPSGMPRGLSMGAWRAAHGRLTTVVDGKGQKYQRIVKRHGKWKSDPEYKIAKGPLPKLRPIHAAAVGDLEGADRESARRAGRAQRKRARRERAAAANPRLARHLAGKERARKCRRHQRRATVRELTQLRAKLGELAQQG
jgi:hypothetical protein